MRMCALALALTVFAVPAASAQSSSPMPGHPAKPMMADTGMARHGMMMSDSMKMRCHQMMQADSMHRGMMTMHGDSGMMRGGMGMKGDSGMMHDGMAKPMMGDSGMMHGGMGMMGDSTMMACHAEMHGDSAAMAHPMPHDSTRMRGGRRTGRRS